MASDNTVKMMTSYINDTEMHEMEIQPETKESDIETKTESQTDAKRIVVVQIALYNIKEIDITKMPEIPTLRPWNFNAGFFKYDDDHTFYTPRPNLTSNEWHYCCIYSGIWELEDLPLKGFPFDIQNIPLHFNLINCHRYTLVFIDDYVAEDSNAIVFNRESLQSDEFTATNMSVCLLYNFYDDIWPYPEEYLRIVIAVRRQWLHYIQQVVVFTFLLSVLAFVPFFFDTTDLESRLSHLTTLILAQIASLYIVSAELPKLPYYTVLDLYILIAFLLSVFVTFSSCFVFSIEDEENAAYYDNVCGVVAIAFMLGNNLFLVFQFFRIRAAQNQPQDEEQQEEEMNYKKKEKKKKRKMNHMVYVSDENVSKEIVGFYSNIKRKVSWLKLNYDWIGKDSSTITS